MRRFCKNFLPLLFILSFVVPPLTAHATDVGTSDDDTSSFDATAPAVVEEAYTPPTYTRAKVIEVQDTAERVGDQFAQQVTVKILHGDEKGSVQTIAYGGEVLVQGQRPVKKGETVVIAKAISGGEVNYYIADTYRLPAMLWIFVLFLLAAVLFGHWKGLSSILGLVVSIGILGFVIVPRIADGANPLTVGLIGAVIIACLSLFLAHGFSRRTSIALVSTIATIGIAALLSVVFVHFTRLFGAGSEDAFLLQSGVLENLDLRGLLLAGIIIGTLGVLDDVTTAQTAAVDELKKANPAFGFHELYARGLSIGREHIASLVNTLALAYVGAALPLFLLFHTQQPQPLWVLANSEMIGEEIVRTLVGSIALVLAVPIATSLAAAVFAKGASESGNSGHRHA